MFAVCRAEFQTYGTVSIIDAKTKLQRVLSQVSTANALRDCLHQIVALIFTHEEEIDCSRYNWVFHVFRDGSFVKEEIVFHSLITPLFTSPIVTEIDSFLKQQQEKEEEEDNIHYTKQESAPNLCVLCHYPKTSKVSVVCKDCNRRTFTIESKDKSLRIDNVMFCSSHKQFRKKNINRLPTDTESDDPHFSLRDFVAISLSTSTLQSADSLTVSHSLPKCVKCHNPLRRKNPYNCCHRPTCNVFTITYRGIPCKGSYCFTKKMMVVDLPLSVPFLTDVSDFCHTHPNQCVHVPLQMLDSITIA